MVFRRSLALAAGLGAAAVAVAQDPVAPIAPIAPLAAPPAAATAGGALVLAADVARARTAGWIDAATSDDAALDAVVATLRRRLQNAARPHDARIERAPGQRIAVTLAGAPGDAAAAALIAGLTCAGRLAYHVVADDADVAAVGARLEGEQRRLQRWRGAHPQAPLRAFDDVPREAGGPHPALAWRAPRGEDDGEPVPLLRAAAHTLALADTQDGLRPLRASPVVEQVGFELTLRDAPARELGAFGARFAGRTLALLLDDEVVSTAQALPELGSTIVVRDCLSPDEWDAFAMAFQGGPLEVPLTLVEGAAPPVRDAERGVGKSGRQER